MPSASTSEIIKRQLVLTPNNIEKLINLCGPFDINIKQLAQILNIKISRFDNAFTLIGCNTDLTLAQHVLLDLYQNASQQVAIELPQIHSAIKQYQSLTHLNKDIENSPSPIKSICIKTKFAEIKTITAAQYKFVKNIRHHTINFGIGPAGTGKTYLAIAAAVEALEKQEINRIILTRPAIEAGEKLGFLPGDLNQKIDPYLKPLFEAMIEMLGIEKVTKLIEKNIIEVAPLGYMRGRTFSDAFILLDEGQNSTVEQMKMCLTRIGYNTTAVITGDITQIDLPRHYPSGLIHASKILAAIEEISFTYFNEHDVVRHPLITKIIHAYEKNDSSITKNSNF